MASVPEDGILKPHRKDIAMNAIPERLDGRRNRQAGPYRHPCRAKDNPSFKAISLVTFDQIDNRKPDAAFGKKRIAIIATATATLFIISTIHFLVAQLLAR